MFEFWTGSHALSINAFLIRALIVYIYIFIMVKVLGQRTMKSIDALDFIFGVVIGDILGEPLTDGELPLAGPIAAAALISFLHLTLSMIALKTPRFRRIIEDEPIILMQHGKILHKQLRKAKITIDTFLMDLRQAGASDLSEIDFAVMEMNGTISVIKKTKYDSLTPNDMGKNPPSKGYPTVLIEDGHIIQANVDKVGTLMWLREQVHKYGYANHKEVFLMTIDEAGSIYISPKIDN
ncbi:DUF421 domain-containing protein [Halalkalibacterium ligniniphilum]|uniref:DUF421 domain-containing protein n=1 Tax=Halalkalibacterium ligniniphilum TaxID=1134413 RepID=UPI0003492B2D|nr:DUF421 domain-containing protein [Halalkalibacterium ligniniphilum]